MPRTLILDEDSKLRWVVSKAQDGLYEVTEQKKVGRIDIKNIMLPVDWISKRVRVVVEMVE